MPTNTHAYRSPAGVLAAADNGARYLSNGAVTEVARGGLLSAAAPLLNSQLGKVMRLEVLPNRDALEYRQQYGLDSPSLHTLFRGTLRYRGFSSLLGSLTALGLTDGSRAVPAGVSSWPDLLRHMGVGLRTPTPPAAGDTLASAGSGHSDRALEHAAALSALEWLGALDPSTPLVLPPTGGSVRDATCSLLSLRLAYGPTDRDAVLMEHQLRVDYPRGGVDGMRQSRVLTSTLVDYGTPGGTSAMARTVGLAAAVGISCVLDSALTGQQALPGGVLRPTLPAVYQYALPKLAEEGLHFNETARDVDETDGGGGYVRREERGASIGVGAAG
jgi:alpha-aminoadipic semialdehyde synthase